MVSSKKGTVDAADNKTAVKAAAPVVDKKVSEKKPEVKKAAEPKAKKAPAKKETALKSVFYVQYAGKEYTEKELLAAVKKAYTKLGNKAADIKSVEIYLKPEESVAYYVINGQGSDEYKIQL